MQEIKKGLRLYKIDYYETHLSIINCLFPPHMRLLPMELKVLARFMAIELGKDVDRYRFSAMGRKIVMKNLGISSSGLSNYMGTLQDKEALIKIDNTITILPILLPEPGTQTYKINLTNLGESPKSIQNSNGVSTAQTEES